MSIHYVAELYNLPLPELLKQLLINWFPSQFAKLRLPPTSFVFRDTNELTFSDPR